MLDFTKISTGFIYETNFSRKLEIAMIYEDGLVKISFYDKDSFSISPDILDKLSKNKLKKLLNLEIGAPVYLRQIHSTKGYSVESKFDAPWKSTLKGDYLVSNLRNISLCIFTADCLPVVAYDKKKNVIGIVHAGWKGSIGEIAVKMLTDFKKKYKSEFKDVKIFFGPSAKKCCYEVDKNFEGKLNSNKFFSKIITRKNKKIFLDLPMLNKLQLQNIGLCQGAFNFDYNYCTICNKNFCSYRREGSSSKRQISMVSIKE